MGKKKSFSSQNGTTVSTGGEDINNQISALTSSIREKYSTPESSELEQNLLSKCDEPVSKKSKKRIRNDSPVLKNKLLTTENEMKIHCKLKSAPNGFEDSNEEDQAESIDSGCVADAVSDAVDISPSVCPSENLLSEYTFINDLLRHTPDYNSFSFIKFEEPLSKAASKKLGKSKKKNSKSNIDTETNLKVETSPLEENSQPCEKPTLKENKKKIELKLRELKAGKLGSIPSHIVRKSIDQLQRKLHVIEKHERKENAKSSGTGVPNCQIKSNVYNQSGNLVFNKFDFTGGKEIWTDNKPNDIKKVMSKVIKEKEKIKHIAQNKQIEAASDRLESNLWDQAMKKADGQKIKDDPLLLAKTVKRKERTKENSMKKWAKHGKLIEKLSKAKQDKRQKNLLKKKHAVIARKMNRGKKGKGGGRPKAKGKAKK